MRIRSEYNLIEECVQAGIEYGYMRAFKHEDEPSEDKIKHNIQEAVMNEISDTFSFDLND